MSSAVVAQTPPCRGCSAALQAPGFVLEVGVPHHRVDQRPVNAGGIHARYRLVGRIDHGLRREDREGALR